MITIDLNDRVAFVTGGASGIGQAACEAMAQCGAAVAVCDIDASRAQEVASAIVQSGGKALATVADVSKQTEVESAVAAAKDRFGPIDIVHTCHGITRPARAHKMTTEDWSTVVNVHLNGTFFVVRATINDMLERQYGRIITITSPAGVQGSFGQTNYAAAKGGIIALTKSLALEYARSGITANAINPVANTPMTEKIRTDPKLEKIYLNMIPMRRWGDPNEIASLTSFLASPLSDYITGQVYAVNGGLTM